MKRHLSVRALTPMLAALALVAAACGSGSGESAETGPGVDQGAAPKMLTAAPLVPDIKPGQSYRPAKLRFASISGADEEASTARNKLFVDYLAKTLGIQIDYVQTTDYSSVIEAMRAGRIDIAGFGPFSFVIAASEANAEPLVALPNQTTGLLGYKSLIITNVGSGVNTIADLKGKTMAFADPASTSGHLFPRLILANNGITDYKTYFKEVVFSGGHDASLLAVENNRIDAAGVCDTCIDRFFREGKADKSKIKVIAESETIPPSPISVRADLDPDLKTRITDAYVAMLTNAPEVIQKANALTSPPKHGYAKVNDAQFNVIRDVAVKLKVDLKELER